MPGWSTADLRGSWQTRTGGTVTTTPDDTATLVRLIQISAERWPVHLATGRGWCGPGTVSLGPVGGNLCLQLDDWAAGLHVGQRVLMVARSWDTTVECFTRVVDCTASGLVTLAWPDELDVAWFRSDHRPDQVPELEPLAA